MFRGRMCCLRPLPHGVCKKHFLGRFHGLTLATFARSAHDGYMLLLTIIQGLSAGLRTQESPLYRYPYRYAEEAIRGDAKRIAADIEACLERLYE